MKNPDIRKISLYLSGKTPPDYQKINWMVFSEALKEFCDFDYEKIKFYYQAAKEHDEEFYYMVLDFLKQADDKKNGQTGFSALLENLKVHGPEFNIGAQTKAKKDMSLPEKILIIEDGDGISVWEKFLENSGIEGVKIVSSQSGSNDSWEESIIKAKKLNGAYNPYIYRVIDSDGVSAEQIASLKAKKKQKAPGLNYNISVLDIHEIENLLLLDKTYQSTSFYTKYPDLAQFIRNNYEIKLKNSFTSTATQFFLSVREDKKESNFSTQVNEMEKQMLLDPIRKINGKEVVNLLRAECGISPTAMILLRNLVPENYSDDLILLLEDIKKYFEL